MKEGLVFGLLALFAAIAFVPPGQAPVYVAQATQPHQKTITIDLPSAEEFQQEVRAVIAATAAASIPKDLRAKSVDSLESLESATALVSASKKTIESAVVQKEEDPVWRIAREEEPDEMIKAQFMLIEWAKEKNDPRACHEISPLVLDEREINGKIVPTPSAGDWLAYCLARVTSEQKRCQQIEQETSPDLFALCNDEFHPATL